MSQDIVILGAGGHAKVLIDIARAAGVDLLACFAKADVDLGDVPIKVGDDEGLILAYADHATFIVGVGEMGVRRRLAALVDVDATAAEPLIHPSAVVSPAAHLDPGVCVMPGAVINAGAKIGRHAVINTGAIIEHDCQLDVGVFVGPGAVLAGDVFVGGWAMIGSRAVARPGAFIGPDSVVGAGSVVVADVAPGHRVAGVPARSLRAA